MAEGVETAGQRRFLATHGCRWCQGTISRPLPVADFQLAPFVLMHTAPRTGLTG
jgi:EAL domain-containing protein (putative c-di-GMP-specific phosphodiesterase class I)